MSPSFLLHQIVVTTYANHAAVSVIVPTIGRVEPLGRLLESICQQTTHVHEVIVADGGTDKQIGALVLDGRWERAGLRVARVPVQPPNAVAQREAAIAVSNGEYLLLLDDDVVLEPECVEHMVDLLEQDQGIVGVVADFNSQSWPMPTRAWRLYLRHALGLKDGQWQGRVVGPLLRFGYNPTPNGPMPTEWLGAGNTMVRRSAYDHVGGFSRFFLHRCTMNEDVDLGLKLRKVGRLVFSPSARLGHFHSPTGRVSPMIAAEDDLHNRYLIIRRTQGRSASAAFALVILFFAVETVSNLGGCLRRLELNAFGARFLGRLLALGRILLAPPPRS